MATKRLREEEGNATTADRLTDLPESLQLRILSSLDARHAVQTSTLSKSWVSSWTSIPVLNFNSYGFKRLYDFDEFVVKTLSLRQSVKLDKLTFKRGGICSDYILKEVFDYALSHGVKELEANIRQSMDSKSWPVWVHNSSGTLTSLKLENNYFMGFPFTGPRSRSFENLANLHLKRVTITDLDPFSRFPKLEKLRLVHCPVNTIDNVLNVHALQLLELIISYNQPYVNHCALTTPKLRYFEYRGTNFSLTTTRGGLPVLDTVVLDYTSYCHPEEEKIMFDDLMMVFNSFYNAKFLTVSSSVFHLLSYFLEELMNRSSPFRKLKGVNVDFSLFLDRNVYGGPCMLMSEYLKLLPGVKAYLLQTSHEAEFTMIYPNDSNARSIL